MISKNTFLHSVSLLFLNERWHFFSLEADFRLIFSKKIVSERRDESIDERKEKYIK